MKHKHHIIPKHMGGSDEENNLIELTIEEHTEAHKKLYQEHGHWQDYLAWQGLSGLMSKEEIVKQMLSEAGKKGGASRSKEDNIRVARNAAKANWKKNKEIILETLRKNAFENKKLKEETGKGIGGHPKNKWIWINDGENNKKVLFEEKIPNGWYKGRIKTWKNGSSNKPKEKVKCPKCNKIGGKPVMKRYHFENCKVVK
jgi:hypothetical protein